MYVRLRQPAISDIAATKSWGELTWGAGRTDDFLEGMFAAIERLAKHSQMGRPRNAIHAGLRSILHRGYVVFYLIEPTGLAIVRIIHEKRNLAALDFADRFEGDDLP